MDEGTLDSQTRLLLLRFACAMAWTDLELHPKEREAVMLLLGRLELDDLATRKQVEAWLKVPPSADEVDPQTIPLEHKEVFLEECRRMAEADGVIRDEEEEALQLLEEILGVRPDSLD